MKVSISDEGYSTYLMKVIPRIWWRLFYVSDEGYSTYPMKIIPRIW
jgi:hypothetical protein